ncbi:hypothetical protein ASC61_13210 [Aeromicrobium sp. Root344]|uniref:hypothetical protein n=1 Tax=Aeromicrobium sp. Root344 TaxID=1736521 RepID=UPI0007017794|nr:hypothetical protein [Aeromicrobium sp. Root344]KQV75888.1 hypothetical protein ASC61_13210 [Aeromicrobium sp. Root344]
MTIDRGQDTRVAGWMVIPVVPALAVMAGYSSGHEHGVAAGTLWTLFAVALLGSALLPALRAYARPTRRNLATVALVVAGVALTAIGLTDHGDAYDSTVFGRFLLIPVGVVMWLCGCLRRLDV